jgi:hypothetical protein
VIATDRRQARVIHKYARALLVKVPAFAQLVDRETDDEIALNNSVTLDSKPLPSAACAATPASPRCATRSRSGDPTSHRPIRTPRSSRHCARRWRRSPALAASSPYARRGSLFDVYRRYHGQDGAPALIWKAPTRTMNSTVPQRVIDEELERDPAKASAEYLAQFRTDIESFVSSEVVDAAVVPGRYELPKLANVTYRGFVDASGGSGAGSMTLAISHRDRDRDGRAILDLVRERRPAVSPERVTAEFAGVLKEYCVRKVSGDRYAGEWPRAQFRKSGIQYETSDKAKSDIYSECLPLLNSGKIELLDHPRLISQLCGLERSTARSGRDSIDHAPSAHDDLCNAAVGALLLASRASAKMILSPQALEMFRAMPPRDRFAQFQPGGMGMPGGLPPRNRFARAR